MIEVGRSGVGGPHSPIGVPSPAVGGDELGIRAADAQFVLPTPTRADRGSPDWFIRAPLSAVNTTGFADALSALLRLAPEILAEAQGRGEHGEPHPDDPVGNRRLRRLRTTQSPVQYTAPIRAPASVTTPRKRWASSSTTPNTTPMRCRTTKSRSAINPPSTAETTPMPISANGHCHQRDGNHSRVVGGCVGGKAA